MNLSQNVLRRRANSDPSSKARIQGANLRLRPLTFQRAQSWRGCQWVVDQLAAVRLSLPSHSSMRSGGPDAERPTRESVQTPLANDILIAKARWRGQR